MKNRSLLKLFAQAVQRFVVSKHKRDNTLIVYGGARDLFIDNAKHLFIYNNENLPGYKHVWLSKNEDVVNRINSLGYKAVRSDSQEGKDCMLHAGMVIYDYRIDEFADHSLFTGAIRFNLWHGVATKHIGGPKVDNPSPFVEKSAFYSKYIESHLFGDYLLSPIESERMNNIFSAALRVPKGNIVKAAYPRCRFFAMNEEQINTYIEKYEDFSFKSLYKELAEDSNKKIIYMPTFRDSNPNYINQAIPDWNGLNTLMEANDITLYLKVHRVTTLPNQLNFPNIRVIDNTLDVYPLLHSFDGLITDYSSILYDFELTQKPILLYVYDLEEYSSSSRYVYDSFRHMLRTENTAKTFEDLKKMLPSFSSLLSDIDSESDLLQANDFDAITHFITEKLQQ